MNTSIRTQFTITILALTAFVAVVLTVVFVLVSNSDHQQFQQELYDETTDSKKQILNHIAIDLAEDLSEAISQGNFEQASTIAETIRQSAMIEKLRLYTVNNGLAFEVSQQSYPEEAVQNAIARDFLSTQAPIFVDGSFSGYVALVDESGFQQAAAKQGYRSYLLLLVAILGLMLLAGIGAYKAGGLLTRPIRRLQEQTKSMDQGMPPASERIEMKNEIGDLARTIYEMAADLELQNRSVKYLAFHDPLTGLSNRVNFQMQLEDGIVDAANRRQQCSLMYIDIDDFKEINDTRGHEYGDRALRGMASRISSCLNKQAEAHELNAPLLARMGGDEFTVLISGKLSQPILTEMSEAILERISEPLEIDGDLFQLSASVGLALYPSDALSASELFNSADLAMYASKSAGKGTYRFFNDSMNENRERIGQIKSEFKAALENQDEMSLVYQPVVNINSGRIVGAEALIRWNHPQKGPLLPHQFMSVVEHNEIALSADLWVLNQVAALLSNVDLSQKSGFRIAANISASNLARKQFSAAAAKCINENPETAQHLQLEVTETYLHRDEEHAKTSLNELKETGASIWLDDFCTGYSSLNHLTIFPVDGIKIDRQFVHQISENEDNRLLVSALVSMSKAFGIDLIAEGVDNTDDLHQLQRLGCEYAQGYLFSKPVAETELIRLIEGDAHLM